jgi:hypothetical protein
MEKLKYYAIRIVLVAGTIFLLGLSMAPKHWHH